MSAFKKHNSILTHCLNQPDFKIIAWKDKSCYNFVYFKNSTKTLGKKSVQFLIDDINQPFIF